MKKMMMILSLIALLGTSAFAATGLIGNTMVKADGTIKVKVGTSTKFLVGTSDAIKAMYAGALTALNSGKMVTAGVGTIDGVTGWNYIKVEQ